MKALQHHYFIYLIFKPNFTTTNVFLLYSVLFGPHWSILSTSVPFGSIRSICLRWSYSLYLVLFGTLWSYSVYYVDFGPLDLFSLLWTYSVDSVLFSPNWSYSVQVDIKLLSFCVYQTLSKEVILN